MTLKELLTQCNQLHDVRVAFVKSAIDEESVDIHLEDINNFHVGRPEYPGKQPAVLSFTGVEAFALDLQFADGVRIGRADASKSGASSRLEVIFNLGKGGEISGNSGLVVVYKDCRVELQ